MSGDTNDDEVDETEKPCPCGTDIPNSPTINCTDCEADWHLKCCGLQGLTAQPIKKLMQNGWRCPSCFELPIHIQPIKKVQSASPMTPEAISTIVSIVNSTVEENLKQLLSPENLTEETAEIADGYTLIQAKRREKSFQKAIEAQKEEEILIDKKKDNLIIYNMPEATNDDKKEEMLEDFRNIQKVYNGRVVLEKRDLTKVTRLGAKAADKTRPILITFSTQEKRKEILTKNMNLKLLDEESNTSTNIYVSTDRTQKQRDADKELRKELTRQKLKNPNLTIRNNRIVPFPRPAQDNTTWASVWE